MKKILTKNTLIVLFAIAALSSLIFGAWKTRDVFGALNAFIALLALIGLIITFRSDQKEARKREEEHKRILELTQRQLDAAERRAAIAERSLEMEAKQSRIKDIVEKIELLNFEINHAQQTEAPPHSARSMTYSKVPSLMEKRDALKRELEKLR